jgi:hypothetical protein
VGPFVQLRWRPSRRVTVDAGTRYDAVNFNVEDKLLSDGIDNWRRPDHERAVGEALGVAFPGRRRTGLALRPGLLRPSRRPTTTELVNQPARRRVSIPDLDPQRAVNIEAGRRGTVRHPRPVRRRDSPPMCAMRSSRCSEGGRTSYFSQLRERPGIAASRPPPAYWSASRLLASRRIYPSPTTPSPITSW